MSGDTWQKYIDGFVQKIWNTMTSEIYVSHDDVLMLAN